MPQSKRFEALAKRPVNQDGFLQEWPEAGIIAMDSPYDPEPSLKIENLSLIHILSRYFAFWLFSAWLQLSAHL